MARTRTIYAHHLETDDIIVHNHRSRRFVEWTVTSVLRGADVTTYSIHNAGNGIETTITVPNYSRVYILPE